MELPSWLAQVVRRDLDRGKSHQVAAAYAWPAPKAEPSCSVPDALTATFFELLGGQLTRGAFSEFFQGIREVRDRAIELFTISNLQTVQQASQDIYEAQAVAWTLRPHSRASSVGSGWEALGHAATEASAFIRKAHIEATRIFYDALHSAEVEAIQTFYLKVHEYECEAFGRLEEDSHQVVTRFSCLVTSVVQEITDDFRAKVAQAKSRFLDTVRETMHRILDLAPRAPIAIVAGAPRDKR